MSKESRLSDKRRKALKEADQSVLASNMNLLSNLCPIERYFAAADKILSAFEDCYSQNQLDEAYMYGRRFAIFSTEALPTHDYYKSPKVVQLRLQSNKDVARVVEKLEVIAERMDEEELEKERIRKAEEKRQRTEERERKEKLRLEKEFLEAGRGTKDGNDGDDLLQDMFPLAPTGFGPSQIPSKLSVVPYKSSSKSNDEEPFDLPIAIDALPPPIPLPSSFSDRRPSASNTNQTDKNAPPSYNNIHDMSNTAPSLLRSNCTPLLPSYDDLMKEKTFNNELSDSLFYLNSENLNKRVNGVVITTPPIAQSRREKLLPLYPLAGTMKRLDPSKSPWETELFSPNSKASRNDVSLKPRLDTVPLQTLKQMYSADYNTMKQTHKVEVFYLSTYQGRITSPKDQDSTNGCTVISPLVAASHLNSTGSGIADVTIDQIIDKRAPPILRTVRTKLGLGCDALIIPSDVHDYLVDVKILKQDCFVGVCGGNVLDYSHMRVFLDMLENGECCKNTTSDDSEGNALNGKTDKVYKTAGEKAQKEETTKEEKQDWSSKKVAAAFFFHEHVVSILKVVLANGRSWYDIVDSMPKTVLSSNGNESGKSGTVAATRTRCKDRESLEVTLRWYACSKFTEENAQYIDRNEWNDIMCDFDPRVFQAFVWREDA